MIVYGFVMLSTELANKHIRIVQQRGYSVVANGISKDINLN